MLFFLTTPAVVVNSLDVFQFSTITSTIEKMVYLFLQKYICGYFLNFYSFPPPVEPSFVSVFTNTSLVDNFSSDASYGRLFGRMDEPLDKVHGESHYHEENVHLPHVHGCDPAVPRIDKCTGKAYILLTC